MAKERIGGISKVLYYDRHTGKEVRRLTVSDGYNPDGTRKKITRTFTGSFNEAKRELAAMITDVRRGNLKPSGGMTVRQWANIWYREHCRTLAPKTSATYRTMLQNYILPSIGHLTLQQLSPEHIDKFHKAMNDYQGIKGKGLIGATQAKCHRVLSVMLQEAVYRRQIPANPVTEARRPPRYQRAEARHYDEQDTQRLLRELQHESARFRAIVLLALTTGMRRGEIGALAWRHVNWQKGLILIEQSAFVTKGTGQQEKAPKTQRSTRAVAMTPGLVDALHAWQAQQATEREQAGDRWQGDGHIFTNPDGSWVLIDQISKDWHRFTSSIHLPEGEISLTVENNTPDTHTLALMGTDINKRRYPIAPHSSQVLTFTAKRVQRAGKRSWQPECGTYCVMLQEDDQPPTDKQLFSAIAADSLTPDTAPANTLTATITSTGLHFDRQPLPPLNFHGLRHTAASILIASGLDVRTVSDVLGHAQTSTTLNTYSHVIQSAAQRAAEAMHDALKPTIEK